MTKTSSFVTLAVATVDIQANEHGSHSAISHLAAIALLIADRDAAGAWTFTLTCHAVAAGHGEDALLLWGLNALPTDGVALGWQLADGIVAPLLDAATVGDPDIGRAFLDRLSRLVTAPSVDLAAHHGGAGAPALAEVAAHHGIRAASADQAEIESAWAIGNVAWLREQVGAEAITAWQLWLAESNGTAREVSAAFDAWLAVHRDLSA